MRTGTNNVITDALSRLEMRSPKTNRDDLGPVATYYMCAFIRNESIDPVEEMCFTNKKAFDFEKFPMRPSLIAKEQHLDQKLQKSFNANRKAYST